jgi:hypothetical protein
MIHETSKATAYSRKSRIGGDGNVQGGIQARALLHRHGFLSRNEAYQSESKGL